MRAAGGHLALGKELGLASVADASEMAGLAVDYPREVKERDGRARKHRLLRRWGRSSQAARSSGWGSSFIFRWQGNLP